MSSTFLGLNTAYTGLQAATAALNTTANNISNAETEGYSRQQVTTQAANAIRAFTSFGCIGAGVETLAIERVRDNFYDEKYWNNNSYLGEYESKRYYMSCIETYYTDDSSIKGFNAIFNDYTNSLSELCKNPNDTTVKEQAIGQAQNLATYFNDMYTNLEKLQDDVNQEMKVTVDRINGIGKEIAALNKQINVIEMNSGAMANELRDQRDILIDELSLLCAVSVEETPVIDTNDTSRDTGGTRYTVYICGQTLVDGNDTKELVCVPRSNYERVNQTDVDGLHDVYFYMGADWTAADYHEKGDRLNVYSNITGGKLGGLIAMRDGNNSEQFAGKVTDVDETKQTVTIDVTKDYLIDLSKLNLTTTGGIIKIGNSEYYFKDWKYNYDEETGKCTYEFQLDNDLNGTDRITKFAATQNLDASVGPKIKYQGLPYYMSQMNEWVRKYASVTNDIVTQGILDNGDRGSMLYTCDDVSGKEYSFAIPINRDAIFAGSDPSSYTSKQVGNKTYYSFSLDSSSDSYYRLTAGNFKVKDEVVKEPAKLATRSKQYIGSDYNDIAEKLKNLGTNQDTENDGMSFRGCSADQYLVCIMSDVALNAQRANDFTSSYTVLKSSIQNQRLSVSGVDNDEEAVNLTKFQQQYNMASKMIQTLSEIYDRLIRETGV